MINAVQVEELMSVSAFLEWLKTRRDLLQGVCVSGGEPTIDSGLPELLRGIRDLGFATKLDTNGTRPAVIEALVHARLCDYVAMDIKAPLDERYAQVAGCSVDLDAIRSSVGVLLDQAPDYELRTTVGPQLDASALEDIARDIGDAKRWVLQPFAPSPEVEGALAHCPSLGADELHSIAGRLQRLVPTVRVRGA